MSDVNICLQRQQELVDNFAFFDDWSDRYNYIIDLGKKLPPMPSEWQTDDCLIEGCQSQVWLHVTCENDHIRIHATSDAVIVKGLIAMVCQVYDDAAPLDILSAPPEFIETVGLSRFLSPTRANGLDAFLKRLFHLVRVNYDHDTDT